MDLRWTEPAARDLTAICDYLEQEAGSPVALEIARRTYKSVRSLADFPRQGRPGRIEGTRELPLPGLPYIVFYEIQHQDVVVLLATRHGAQRWPPE